MNNKASIATPSTSAFSVYTLHRKSPISRGVALATDQTQSEHSSTPVSPPTCSCRYLWRKELHGLSQLMMSHSNEMRLFWLAVVIACFAAAIWNAQYILGTYLSHDTQTRMKIKQVKTLQFPNLIFCPNNPDALHIKPIIDDMTEKIGIHSDEVYKQLLKYMIAGSGFDYINGAFSTFDKAHYQHFYELWRGNRSTAELFDFVFEQNFVSCAEFFFSCTQGALVVNCCDIFAPTYVMLRGKCFKLDNYYQNDADELAKLRVFIKRIPSVITDKSGFQPNVIMFMGDENKETSTFPRYYLNPGSWNKFRFFLRLTKSLSSNPRCSTSPISRGWYTCYVYNWLTKGIKATYNCTLPYYRKLNYMFGLKVCDVQTIITNYTDIKWARLERFKCLPSCSRREVSVDWLSKPDDDSEDSAYSYRLEAAFNELQYEEYDEIHTTTLAHFISELGGQTGLFLGTSLLTFVQLLVAISLYVYRHAIAFYERRKPIL